MADFVSDYSLAGGKASTECYQQELTPLQWSEFMGEYNTLDTVVRDRSSKSVMK